eukprot:554616-Prymnesium_polylepis.1
MSPVVPNDQHEPHWPWSFCEAPTEEARARARVLEIRCGASGCARVQQQSCMPQSALRAAHHGRDGTLGRPVKLGRRRRNQRGLLRKALAGGALAVPGAKRGGGVAWLARQVLRLELGGGQVHELGDPLRGVLRVRRVLSKRLAQVGNKGSEALLLLLHGGVDLAELRLELGKLAAVVLRRRVGRGEAEHARRREEERRDAQGGGHRHGFGAVAESGR